ncbi:putative SPRY domain-containing protein [Seiridium cardinale]
MTNPYQNAPSGLPQDGGYISFLPRNRGSHASASGTNPATFPSSHPSLSRLSNLLNQPHNTASELYTTHHSYIRTGSGAVDSDRNAIAPDGAAQGLRQQPAQLPSFSRAFEMFMNPAGDSIWSTRHRSNGLFTPSYLANSAYMHKLEEAHMLKQAQRESQHQAGASNGMQSAQPPSVSTKPVSHLGMTYDLIERVPTFEDDDTIAPLPTKWNRDDKHGGLEVMAEGQEVKYTAQKAPGERDYEAYAIRADHAAPNQAGIYYYETTLLSRKRDETTVCVGFTSKSVSLARPPGWEAESYGYHGDDGQIYNGTNQGKHYGPIFTTGDTIGCGLNFRTGNIFFTRNGVNLGIAFRDVKGKVYPVVGMKRNGEHVQANFGQTPFVYDIDGMMKQEQAKVRKAISETSTAKLAGPSTSETDLIQQLVLQFLQHDGYVETARAFAEEIQSEKQALSLDAGAPVEGINIKDDEDANRRQRIRRAILEGDVDKAHKYTNLYYPHVLKDNEQVYFKLRCRKFIEMVRRSSYLSNHNRSSSKKSNGHAADDSPNEMDLDEDGYSDQMDTQDVLEAPTEEEAAAYLNETIAYGRELSDEFKDDPRREVGKALQDIFSLMAYATPLQEKDLAHFFERKARVLVAEELNSAILSSLGRSSRSALETLYSQTSVLLEYLRENGGPGAFVTVQSVMDEIPKSPY